MSGLQFQFRYYSIILFMILWAQDSEQDNEGLADDAEKRNYVIDRMRKGNKCLR